MAGAEESHTEIRPLKSPTTTEQSLKTKPQHVIPAALADPADRRFFLLLSAPEGSERE